MSLLETRQRVLTHQIYPRLRFGDGCWTWTGYRDAKGYGVVRIGGRGGKNFKVHRWVYCFVNGPMPEGLVTDHLCRNRACCNPRHLQAVSPWLNAHRGVGQGAINAAKLECPRGHPYTQENTRITYGRRRCRTCQRLARSARRKA